MIIIEVKLIAWLPIIMEMGKKQNKILKIYTLKNFLYFIDFFNLYTNNYSIQD